MKRVGNLMEEVVSFRNLRTAFEKAAKGKRRRPVVRRFFRDLEPELLSLRRELADGSYRPGGLVEFTIFDPKERLISVPPFRDRVVHHAVVNVLEPIFEARFDPDSYGCRKGKGMDAALRRTQEHVRGHPFCLKTDVSKFFPSVDHAVLKALYRRILKDRALLALLDVIVLGHDPGLPIGSLTSQWLANLYLTPLDRFLRTQPGTREQVRYMDDVLVFGTSRGELRDLLAAVRSFVETELRLSLKPTATKILPVSQGVPFLGFRVRPGRVEVRRETFRRFREGLSRTERAWHKGRLSTAALAASAASRIAHLTRAASLGLRRAHFAREPPIEW